MVSAELNPITRADHIASGALPGTCRARRRILRRRLSYIGRDVTESRELQELARPAI